MVGVGRVAFELLPQTVHVHGDRGEIPEGLHAPHPFAKSLSAEHRVGMQHEEVQQVVFPMLELDLLAAHAHSMRGGIQLDLPQADETRGAVLAGQTTAALKVRLDEGDKHAGEKGFSM